MVTRTVAAHTLRIGQIVIPDNGSPRRITSARVEGAPPRAVIEYAGITSHTSYLATQTLTVQTDQ